MRKGFLLLTAAAAFAADPAAKMASPVLGYVFDSSSKAVRPIAGIPGAAALEGALPSAAKLEIGFVSPNGRFLLAATLDGAVLIDLHNKTTADLENGPADIALGSWSPDSKTFALWTRSGKLQVWTGVPDSAALKFSADVESPAGIAVADGGAVAAFWNDSGLRLVDGAHIEEAAAGPIAAAAFRAGSVEWAAVTEGQLIRSSGDPVALDLVKPSAVAFGSRSVLAGGEKALSIFDENGARTIACDCAATTLERLAGTDVFRLTGVDSPSIAIYDGDSDEPRIVYIPAEGGRQ